MPETKQEFTVPAIHERQRIDKYLSQQVGARLSRSRIQNFIKQNLVHVNDHPVKANYLVAPRDRITILIPPPVPHEALPEDIPLDVVYEDKNILVVNKPAGMVVHPAHGNYTHTLVNALLHHCRSLSTLNDSTVRPGIVHRLDKDTSGLLVVAKDDVTHRFLAKQFSSKTTERTYWALVWGTFKQKKGKIETQIGRSSRDRKKMTVLKFGKQAITHYQVLQDYDFLSLIKLNLETGRTHQIRVHLAHIHHPVFGDPAYGGRLTQLSSLSSRQLKKAHEALEIMPRQALHAKTLGFIHPGTKKTAQFDSDLPGDIKKLLDFLN